MGIRTPDLLHAMRIRSVDLRRRESNGEPPTCGNCLSGSGCVRGCLNTVAPVSGSPALSAPERGPMAIEFKEHCMAAEGPGRPPPVRGRSMHRPGPAPPTLLQSRAVRWPSNVQPYFDAMLLD